MRRDINLMVTLIKNNFLFVEEFSGRPLLPEDLPYSLSYREATVRDIPSIAISRAWNEMLSSGRAFFVGRA